MERASGFTHDNKDNASVDWWTPKWVFDALDHKFDLDPCCPPGGVPWIPAKKHYSLPDDGLALPWEGSVWLNPPYGKHTGTWLEKMHRHRRGITLVFARTDCRWFHDYIVNADAVLFLKGRISFVDGLGATKSQGAGAGSLMAAWGQKEVDALARLQNRGWLVRGMEF